MPQVHWRLAVLPCGWKPPSDMPNECLLTYDLINSEMRLIVTLIPYTSFREHTAKIQEAHLVIEQFSKSKRFDIVDINPERSADGVLKSEYTFHFDG
jgi:hypothetical protein